MRLDPTGFVLWSIIHLVCYLEVQATACSITCAFPTSSNESTCDSSTGNCLYGCKDGYTGIQCQLPCGSNCTRCEAVYSDSNAIVDTECSKCDVTTFLNDSGLCQLCEDNCRQSPDNSAHACGSGGVCLLGCTDGFGGRWCNISCGIHRCLQCTINSADQSQIFCDECAPTYYLSDGGKACTNCKQECLPDPDWLEPTCQANDGFCKYGCKGGNKCGRLCQNGCGGLCVNAQCDRTTCCCTEGCFLMGYTGCRCNENCQDSCVDELCYQNGTCTFGCKPNFWNYQCQPCSSTCKDDGNSSTSTCNANNGFCNDGCIGNTTYWGPICEACSNNCRHGGCNSNDGHCIDGCVNNATWGPTCETKCPENCMHSRCNSSDGYCINGCVANATWGLACGYKCPDNCMNDECNANNGYCTHGCINSAFWGPTCQPCPDNCMDGKCYANNGFCSEGCINNATWGPTCDIKCSNNCMHGQCSSNSGLCDDGCINNITWGTTCDKKCREYCMDGQCSQTNGLCINSCVNDTFWGPTCIKCPDNCMDGQCYVKNGSCSDGCINKATWGLTCDNKCSGSCMHGECNSVNGVCNDGCVNNATWGPTCETICSSGCMNGQCNSSNGFCNEGCVNNFTCGTTCEMICPEYGKQDVTEERLSEQYTLGAVTGAFTATGIIAVVMILGFLVRRYWSSRQSTPASNAQIPQSGQNDNDTTSGYEDLSVERSLPTYEMIRR